MLAGLALLAERERREVDVDGRGAAGVAHGVAAAVAGEQVGAGAAVEDVVAVVAETRSSPAPPVSVSLPAPPESRPALSTSTVTRSLPSPSVTASGRHEPVAQRASCAEISTQVGAEAVMVAPGSTKAMVSAGPGRTWRLLVSPASAV